MRLAQLGGYWYIMRGREIVQYFGFFVDDDSAAWSKRRDQARIYKTAGEAESDMNALKLRARLKRQRKAENP